MKNRNSFLQGTLYTALVLAATSCSLMPVDLMTINEIRSMSGSDNASVNWSSNYDSNTGTKKRIEVTLTNPDKVYLDDHEKAKELSEKIVSKFVDAPGDLGKEWHFVLILTRGDDKTTIEMDEGHVREILEKQTADTGA